MRAVSLAASFEIGGIDYSNKSGSGPVLGVCVCQSRSEECAMGPGVKGWILILSALGRIIV